MKSHTTAKIGHGIATFIVASLMTIASAGAAAADRPARLDAIHSGELPTVYPAATQSPAGQGAERFDISSSFYGEAPTAYPTRSAAAQARAGGGGAAQYGAKVPYICALGERPTDYNFAISRSC